MLTFVVLIWPALWAAALTVIALAGDLTRHSTGHQSAIWHKAT